VLSLTEQAAEFRHKVENNLPAAIQSVINMPSDATRMCGGEDVIDHNLLRIIQTYTSLVKIAPSDADISGNTTQVIKKLKAKLNETIAQYTHAAETPQHINLKHKALLRLKRWEPTGAVGNGMSESESIFQEVATLESALIKEGSLTILSCNMDGSLSKRPDPALVPLVSHTRHMRVVVEEIIGLINIAKDQLSKPYDPKIDPSIDPKTLEMILSREMDELIAHIAPEIRFQVVDLKTTATDKEKCILA